jgi:hypothetical protein
MGPLFTSGKLDIEDFQIALLRDGPGGKRQVRVTVQIQDRSNQKLEKQVYFGRMFRSDRAKAILSSLNRRNLAQPKFGPPVMYLPECELMLWAYPNDPRLTGLSLMADAEQILTMAKAAPEKFGLTHPPVAITSERTKYVRGQRCGYIYHMTLPSSSCKDGSSLFTIYGKAYKGNGGKKAYGIVKRIWESTARKRGDLVIPQPYSYDSENKILWQEALSGQPFSKMVGKIKDLAEVAKEIGERLAAFHGIHLDVSQEMTFDFQIEEVRKSIARMSKTFPGCAQQCDALGNRLLNVAARIGPGPLTPVHASFKFSHIFYTGRGIAFIDFDGANLGDPGYDLGRFIAHLLKMKSNAKIDPGVAERTIANFCDTYNRATSSPVPQDRINWFAASHLLSSQGFKAVKRMKPGLVSELLNMADHRCPA